MRKLLIIQAAALGYEFLAEHCGVEWGGLTFKPVDSPFPALTCPAQAVFRTANQPVSNGITANGFYDRKLGKVMFWEQSAALVEGPRIWDEFRKGGGTTAMFFWQQSIGEDVDLILTPAPIHKHHGGMIQDCYSQPAGLYDDICAKLGRKFDLKHYWGPLASSKASLWIAEATAQIMSDKKYQPDLCMTYLPALDYDLQRFGIGHARSKRALSDLFDQLDLLRRAAESDGYEILIFGDYAIGDVSGGPVYLNRLLSENGMFSTRRIGEMLYPDLHKSRAFAMVDHEVAHIYIKSRTDEERIVGLLRNVDGVGTVASVREAEVPLGHARSGELVAMAAKGSWFAYPWWIEEKQAPEYASHVDIHNKPGYDPCELFFGRVPWRVSTDATKVKGSHGLVVPGRETCWASSCIEGEFGSLLDLALGVREWMKGASCQ